MRRQADNLLPNREVREYRLWMAQHIAERQSCCNAPVADGLLSVLTPVWNGSPVRYLRTLAESLVAQNPHGACEWVLLDNGCSNAALAAYLKELAEYSWVKVRRVETNIGIVAGLRDCLERATGRYVLPVDADDYLYPDALQVIGYYLDRARYPPLLYSDEDKVIGNRFYQPYFKPDWDPVLFLNSAYVAHLGVIDRQKARELGAYGDPATEGSPDWDLFIRFMLAGCVPVHIPEVLYSWRVHAHSTADDAAAKPYVHSSQRAVLQRFLNARELHRFTVEYSPLLGGAAHWHFVRTHLDAKPLVSVVLTRTSRLAALVSVTRDMAQQDGLIHFIGEDVQIENPEWSWEALGLFELHPDTAMVGGRIRNSSGVLTEAGSYFGVRGACGCPYRGASFLDSGYFTQLWKQRSVSAVSIQFSVVRAAFLADLLRDLPPQASLPFLGAWAGARAARTGKRVVYSPFLSGISDLDWQTLVTPQEKKVFADLNRDLIPDQRYYPRSFSLDRPFRLSTPAIPHA